MRLGITTDTQDCMGQIVGTRSIQGASEVDIIRTFSQFVGTIAQIPPMYSAKKVAGKRLYTMARQGHTVERDARQVTIHALNILDITLPDIRFEVTCSAGTYVRTLAHDLGEALGCGAHLTALTRTRSGTFRLENALSLDHLSDMSYKGELTRALIPGDQAVAFLPAIMIDNDLADKLIHGLRVPISGTSVAALNMSAAEHTRPEHLCRVYRNTDDFIAIAQWVPSEPGGNTDGLLQPRKVFV
jgi:tRNA pseudouridine55 synthase